MPKARTSAGVTRGSSGAKSVNPLYAAARGVARYVGGAAREIRDIPTAIGATITRENQVDDTIRRQVEEAAAAITAGQRGTSASHAPASGNGYNISKKRK